MRWDDLFDDLESQLEHELAFDDVDLRAEEERLRLGRLSLRDRLIALSDAVDQGSPSEAIRLALPDGAWIAVRPHTFGRDWLAADLVPSGGEALGTGGGASSGSTPGASAGAGSADGSHRRRARSPQLGQCIVPISAITAITASRREVVASLRPTGDDRRGTRIAERIGLAFVLRDLCRRRSRVELTVRGAVHDGTIDRVGRDHLDLAVHEADSPRRESAVRRYLVLPIDAVLLARF